MKPRARRSARPRAHGTSPRAAGDGAGGGFAALPTEAIHPAAESLDALATTEVVRLLVAEEAKVAAAVARQAGAIAALADRFAATLAGGGRVVYAGAGTSGRLGLLDAVELGPTFGLEPGRVVGLLAGGPAALRRAVEDAEDRTAPAVAALARLRLGPRDLLIGIAASGVTPFALAAVEEAHRRGAATGFITCGPGHPSCVDHPVHVAVGAEVVAGSTRLKAGTATKLILNAVSTAAMVRLGKVHRGRMVDLRARSAKLRDRALRTVVELGGVERARAATLLRAARDDVKLALAAALTGLPVARARAALVDADGHLARLPRPPRRR